MSHHGANGARYRRRPWQPAIGARHLSGAAPVGARPIHPHVDGGAALLTLLDLDVDVVDAAESTVRATTDSRLEAIESVAEAAAPWAAALVDERGVDSVRAALTVGIWSSHARPAHDPERAGRALALAAALSGRRVELTAVLAALDPWRAGFDPAVFQLDAALGCVHPDVDDAALWSSRPVAAATCVALVASDLTRGRVEQLAPKWSPCPVWSAEHSVIVVDDELPAGVDPRAAAGALLRLPVTMTYDACSVADPDAEDLDGLQRDARLVIANDAVTTIGRAVAVLATAVLGERDWRPAGRDAAVRFDGWLTLRSLTDEPRGIGWRRAWVALAVEISALGTAMVAGRLDTAAHSASRAAAIVATMRALIDRERAYTALEVP